MFDRKILIFMTSFNWKKFAHLNISPQTNGQMKNKEHEIMKGGVCVCKERKTRTESKAAWDKNMGDKK